MANPFKSMHPERVVAPLQSDHKAGVIRELVRTLEKGAGGLDLRGLLSCLFQCETAKLQASDEGLVIVHTCASSVTHPVLLLGVSPKGVQWNEDSPPAHVVFLGVWPSGHESERCEAVSEAARILRLADLGKGAVDWRSGRGLHAFLAGKGSCVSAAA